MGRKALAQVTNIEKNDKTYDRITSLLPSPKAAAPKTAEVDISELPIVEWWTFVRSPGPFTQMAVRAMAAEMYDGREPKDLDGKEREAVFLAL